MSNTSSNKTSKTNRQTVKVIVGEIGRDTKTGILGRGYSYDNGATFHVTDTMFGRLYDKDDGERMWPNMAHKVADEIKSATADLPNVRKQADSAVKFAESAIAASKVNSDAIVAQSEAISEAKSAMDSATAEIQQTAANAASDAAKIRADVARVQNEVDTAKAANSASVEALKSDINTAKQDLADVHDSLDKAQSAIEQNQKLINDSVAKITSDVSATKQDLATVHDSLTKAQAAAEQNQKAINDSIAEINANVDATNQDLAGVRKDLTKAQSDITANQKAIDDNVAQISDDITQDRKDIADVRQGLTKAQSDIIANQKAVNDNVAQINSDIEQDRKDIASAQQANADTVKQLDAYSKQAQEQGKTIKAVQDKQDGFSATLADVQGNVSQVSDKVSGLSASLKDAQDNVANVKTQADQLSATLTDHSKSIAILTASAKELSSTLEDADGRLSKVEQTAQTNSSTLSDVQGDLSQVKQNATKLVSTLKDAQGNISTLQQKADSLSTQLASAQGDIATLQTGIDGVKAILTSHDKSIHTLQADSKSLKDSMVNAQGDISTLRKTATDVTSELEDHTGRLSKVEQSAAKQATTLSDLQGNLSQVEQKADSNTATISSINKNAMQDRGVITDTKTSFDSLTQLGTYSIKASGLPKMPEQHYGTLVVSGSAGSGWLSQQFVADTTGNVYTRVFSNNAWSAWKQGGSQDAINQVKQTADSNSATIRNVQGDVSTLKQTATGIKSTLASHEGDIHTLQADSKSLKDSMTNAQGDISTLQKSATSLDSEMKDHAGRLSKVEQNAATQATTLSDLQGNLSQVKQQADGLVTTLKDAQGDITQIQQKADGTLAQLKSAQGDITSLQTNITGIKATLVSHEGDIHTLQADSRMLKDDMKDAQGNISSLQKSSTKLDSEMSSQDGRLSKVEQTATEHSTTISDLGKKVDSNGGGVNLLTNSQGPFRPTQKISSATVSDNYDVYNSDVYMVQGQTYTVSGQTNGTWSGTHDTEHVSDNCVLWLTDNSNVSQIISADTMPHTFTWPYPTKSYHLRVNAYHHGADNPIYAEKVKIERGSVATPYSPAPEDLATVTQVKQTADGIETTLKSAQGDIDQIKQTAKGTSEQLSNVQGDVTNIQKDVNGLKQTTADNAGNIHTLQSDSKALQDDMKDAKGNISSLQKTSTSLVSEFRDHDGRLSKVEQTATEHTSELADTKGNIDKVTQKANTLQLLLSDAQKNINDIKIDAQGLHQTLTGQSNQLASLNVTLNNLDSKYSGITGDLQSKQTALSTEQQQTKDMLLNKADKSEVDNVKGTVNQVSAKQKVMADQINQKVSSTEYQTLKDKVNNLQVGGDNLVSDGDASAFNATPWGNTNFGKHEFYYNSTKNMFVIATSAKTELASGSNWFPVKAGQQYTLYFNGFMSYNVSSYDVWLLGKPADKDGSWSDVYQIINGQRLSSSKNCIVTKTFTVPNFWNNYVAYVRFDNNGSTDGQDSVFFFNEVSLKEGNINTGYSPSPDDAIASIKKNSTAIDENSKLISLMAKQTEVDNIKGTAQQLSARLDVMAGEIKSKVDETRVNNIVDGKGYATTSTVQSLVDQKAGTINESIVKLSGEVNNNNGGGINLLKATDFANTDMDTLRKYWGPSFTIRDGVALQVDGLALKSGSADATQVVQVEPDTDYTLSFEVHYNTIADGGNWNKIQTFLWEFQDAQCTKTTKNYQDHARSVVNTNKRKDNIYTIHTQPDCRAIKVIFRANSKVLFSFVKPKLERGNTATPYSPAPSDNATVTQLQSVTASIDGLQSRVTNYQNDTSSKYTQLSNLMQSKVGTADFEQLKRSVDMQTLDSADINNMKTNGHYFVHNLANNPIGGWVYVDVTGDGKYRIRQDVYQDSWNKHKFRSWYGDHWTNWEEGATYSEITQLQDAINLRVQKGELLSQINLTAGNTLIQSNKLYLDASSVVITGTAFIPSAAIASLSADKVNTGWLNTNNVNLGDGRTRIIADHDYMYIQPTGSAASNTGIRMGYSGLDFLTNVIPNGYSSSVPYYSVGYDGAANGYFKISAFDHINPGGTTATQNWFTMYDAISLNNKEVNIAANNKPRIRVTDNGIEVRPTIFFNNENYSGTWAGFTRLDNKDVVEFNTGNNDGENFHVNSGARFMKYVYFNDYCRAQGWLTYSTLSKKTNIKKLDTSLALDKIRQDDQYLYEYKRNVAKGVYDPQASFIIDDVNDVSHYSVPREFIDQTGKYREPSVELSYLIAAFQEIDKQVQKQKEEIKELKEKLQHE